jgi:hypothetical protein
MDALVNENGLQKMGTTSLLLTPVLKTICANWKYSGVKYNHGASHAENAG